MTHPELVKALAKPGEEILKSLTAEDAHILHMALAVPGEVGELIDALKKALIYRKPLDIENVKEELGDIEFYLEGIRAPLGITREETLEGNIKKLSQRYASLKYSNEAAINRADK
jgi:NTP pyrophosphatase (non-canonical NTP hydrolase)